MRGQHTQVTQRAHPDTPLLQAASAAVLSEKIITFLPSSAGPKLARPCKVRKRNNDTEAWNWEKENLARY